MTTDAPSFEEASRFLCQAAFGPTPHSVRAVRDQGLEGWFLAQTRLPRRPLLSRFQSAPKNQRHFVYPLFWEGAIHGEDQLRQRAAYALSRIVVVSLREAAAWPDVFVTYADHLAEQAFGNYVDLLRALTYSPAMGLYLSHLGNQKADPTTGAAPDENYARELMQLFTIGLVPLTDGAEPQAGQTYGPDDVAGLAAILTGLSWAGLDRFRGGMLPQDDPRRLRPMDAYPVAHEQRTKRFLGYEAEGANPITAIDGALAHLMDHPNTAPFVGYRLIQAMVTSNPSPAYVARVSRAFRTGRHVLPSGAEVGEERLGDMTATLAAILFDPEARAPERVTAPAFGRLREPTLRFAHAIRAFAASWAPTEPPEPLSAFSNSRLSAEFAEQPWNAPSVFGAFGEDYRAPGSEAGAAGLVTPEAEAVNTSSVLGYMHRAHNFGRHEWTGPIRLDLEPLYDAIREGPEAATALLSERLYHGVMPPASRAGLTAALSRLSGGANETQRQRNLERSREYALAWALTDTTFAVQR